MAALCGWQSIAGDLQTFGPRAALLLTMFCAHARCRPDRPEPLEADIDGDYEDAQDSLGWGRRAPSPVARRTRRLWRVFSTPLCLVDKSPAVNPQPLARLRKGHGVLSFATSYLRQVPGA